MAVIGTVVAAVAAVVVYGAISTHDQQLHAERAAARPATTPAGNGALGNGAPGTAAPTTVPLTPQQIQARAWSDQINGDFAPLTASLQPLLLDVKPWEDGTGGSAAAAAVSSDASKFLPDFQAARQALLAQAPLSLAPQALADYRAAADLYTESVRLIAVAAAQPAGPLEHQIQLSSDRVRELADRIYDQATVVLQPFTPAVAPVAGVTIVRPLDVPVWAEIGLAAGPPLDTATPAAPKTGYQAVRPQEPLARWRAQVEALDLPSAPAEAQAIGSGTATGLRAMSDLFATAEARLTSDPDPTDGRVVATRFRLGLLVDAEATRTAEEASLLGSSAATTRLQQVAAALAVTGDGLWDPQLGPRTTGLTASY